MKIRIFIFIFLICILACCRSNKDFAQRKSFMMPQKSDLARNSKYTAPKAQKTYKVTNQKISKTKKAFGQ